MITIENYLLQEGLKLDQLSEFFPKLFTRLKKNTLIPIGQSVKYVEEEKMVRQYLKGINVHMRIIRGQYPDIMTIPGIYLPKMKNADPFSISIFTDMLNAFRLIKKRKIFNNAINQNGIITFTSAPKNFEVMIIVSTKFAELNFSEKERISIYLHEMGHWKYVNYTLLSVMSRLSNLIFFFPLITAAIMKSNIGLILFAVMILFLFLSIFFSRIGEYKSDSYAKHLGYGKELANSLKKVDLFFENKVKKLSKHQQEVYEIHKKLEIILSTHPLTKDRIKKLLSESIINEGKISEILFKQLKPLCNTMDNIVSQNIKAFFPAAI